MKKVQKAVVARANKSRRTFTLRKYHDGKIVVKYRTLPLTLDEFVKMNYYTSNDWLNFLKSNYYVLVETYKNPKT